jgi:asparagine synthase (glutamine-hydrolysing)
LSGIFGYVDIKKYLSEIPVMSQMASAMVHRNWYVVDCYEDDARTTGLGRLGIGIFNQTPQPVWNNSGSAAIVWAGEIYNINQLKYEHLPTEQALLELYSEHGQDFVRLLNGAFVLGLWDKAKSKLLIATDRFGMYSLFYAIHSGRLVFAPEFKGVLCDPDVPRCLDMTGMAQYMRFQHFLGDRTYFEDIKRLPGASILIFDALSGQHSINTYWSYAEIPHRPEVSFEEAVEETGRLLRTAVRRLSGDRYRPGVFLSGGLDSRILIGMIDRPQAISLTFGHRNSRDVYYAEKIARAVGSKHYWFDLPNGDWVKENVDFHFTLTEGFHNWVHAHGITMLPTVRDLIDVNLTGWDGGDLLGHPLMMQPLQYAAVDDYAFTAWHYNLFINYCTWPGLTESEERMLYTPQVLAQVQGLAFDSFREELRNYLDFRQDVRGDYFVFSQHCMRMTHNMVVTGRSHIEFRYPYFDYHLFDFVMSLPIVHRKERMLARAILRRELPHLAKIPYDADEFLPTTNTTLRRLHSTTIKLKRRFNQHIFHVFPEKHTLYADYEGYLRGELLPWAEQLMFDRRTIERGIFNPDFVKSLFSRHCSGLEEWTIGKIAPLMTYEMALRAYCDNSP